MKYKKKPVEVEAVQITDEWFDGEHPNPLHPISEDREIIINPLSHCIEIKTAGGIMIGNVGDWIITRTDGERWETYPIKDFMFKKLYEPV